jgi:hypothetical protein
MLHTNNLITLKLDCNNICFIPFSKPCLGQLPCSTTAQTSLAVVFIPQFILFFMFFMGHLKVGEVAVETTDARLAPGS